jgi:hypothetical protein
MSFTLVSPWVVGNPVTKVNLDKTFDNTNALREARHVNQLGGHFETQIVDVAFRVVPAPIFVEIDGSNLANLIVEVHVMCTVVTGTGTFQLWNKTLNALVAGSATTFTNTSAALVKSAALTLASGLNVYELQMKGSTANDRPCIWGAKVVLR